MRLRRVDCGSPGISRKRRGRGFAYVWPDGTRVEDPDVLARIEALVLPPAWQDVWICPYANGHIQATGMDAAGRRQYRYHDVWRAKRDAAKHERVLEVAERLPAARQQVDLHLSERGLTRNRVLGCAFRLLDLGFFRVGGEQYAEENNTFGLATMRREHVHIRGRLLEFEYVAKSGKDRVHHLVDEDTRRVVSALLKRDDASQELLAYKVKGTWYDIRSTDINVYLRDVVGADISAKDFRTWHATVLTAIALGVSHHVPPSESARKRAVARAVKEVSHYLGNTPTVARTSYIDPRVIDLYNSGITIFPTIEDLDVGATEGRTDSRTAVEAAVLDLLRTPKKKALAQPA